MARGLLAGFCVVLVLAFTIVGVAAQQSQPSASSFAGTWRTTFGDMTLKQDGVDVTGSYVSAGLTGEIEGKVDGRTLTFTYKEPNATGEGSFELSPDGASFSGRWRVAGTQPWGQWEGQRVDAGAATAVGTFTGVWSTSFGSMRLSQAGKKVEGIYSWAGRSTIVGEIDDKGSLRFTYDQPDGEKGEGTFILAAGGLSFNGEWKSNKGGGGSWSGTRVPTRAGVVWLIVLEAPWEAQLRDNEFSYGLMLRTFFARVPKVQVRHRSISDEADVRKWCGELPYLTEPIVLYFSSHGTAEGLTLGGKPIGAEVLIDCLRDVDNLKLLHFGSCFVAGGDVPKKIHAGLGQRATFPISGFTKPADWAGSALVDFAYLEMIFSGNATPAAAAEQVRKMMTFANDKPTPGTAVPPTGLIVIDPPGNVRQ